MLQVSTPAALLCALHGSEAAGSGLLQAVLCPGVTFLLSSSQLLLFTLWALHIFLVYLCTTFESVVARQYTCYVVVICYVRKC